MQLLALFDKSPKSAKTISTFLLIVVVGFLNLLTGWEIDFSLFYILPVAFSTWFLGLRAGVIACIVCTGVWFWVDLVLIHTYTSEFFHYWNTSIRLLFFLLFAFLLNTLRNSHERERSLARTDGLTGVVNSRYFYELLELELARSKRYKHPFSLAYLDLDNFKTVNDQFGHTTGDKALRTITDYVKKNLRTMDVPGRLGGDEFALLFPETDQNSVRTIVTKLQNGLLQVMHQHGWPITFSIGVITCDTMFPDADDLIKSADELMYSVKNSSKNAVKYDNYRDRI
jgi:diguanylate cyclase (GGDEF)-like protein